MEKKLIRSLLIVIVLSFFSVIAFSEESKEEKAKGKGETYRVVGVGTSLKDAEIDAYQNAIIEFFKNHLFPEDIKKNSSKLLKEFFSLNKIKSYINSTKIVSREDSSEKVKIVVDVTLNTQKILEVLEKLDIKLRDTEAKKLSKEEN